MLQMTTTNQYPGNEIRLSGLIDVNYFICPQGGLHKRGTVNNIWTEEYRSWFRKKYKVIVEFEEESVTDWEWNDLSKEEAAQHMEYLIKELVIKNSQPVRLYERPN